MRNNLLKKGLVVGIIFLFIGAGVFPCISGKSSLNNSPSDSSCTQDLGGIMLGSPDYGFGIKLEIYNWGNEHYYNIKWTIYVEAEEGWIFSGATTTGLLPVLYAGQDTIIRTRMLFGLAIIHRGLHVRFEYDGRDDIETWPFPSLLFGPFTKSYFHPPPYNPVSSDYVL